MTTMIIATTSTAHMAALSAVPSVDDIRRSRSHDGANSWRRHHNATVSATAMISKRVHTRDNPLIRSIIIGADDCAKCTALGNAVTDSAPATQGASIYLLFPGASAGPLCTRLRYANQGNARCAPSGRTSAALLCRLPYAPTC